MRTILNLQAVIFFISGLLLPLHASQQESNSSFYAVSSLCYYLNGKLTDTIEQQQINDEELALLWERASSAPEAFNIPAFKEVYYRATLEAAGDRSRALLEEVLIGLQNCWEGMNILLMPRYQSLSKRNDQLEYLLPEDSSLRPSLERLFSDQNVIATPETFKEAGFMLISARSSGMYVASHKDLPGHLVKVYILSKKIMPTWSWAVDRCMIVRKIGELIKLKSLKHFTVPNKWIYTSNGITNPEGDLRGETSQAILVATHMNLVPKRKSIKMWKKASKRLIQELYCILSHDYASCTLSSNIPYTYEGKFACIDTENLRPSPSYHHVNKHLSEEMIPYWEHLVRTGGEELTF